MKNKTITWHQKIVDRWELYKSPGTPSKGDIKVFEGFLKKIKKPKKALILGATPQLRDLAHKYQLEVTIIDISLFMMQALIRLMKYKKKTEQEIWVRANWLDNPLAENYFDVVLGDLVKENIPFSLQEKFCKKISSLLKRNGYFIVRELVIINSFLDPYKILDYYLKKGDISFKGKNLIGELFEDLSNYFNLRKPPYSRDTHQVIKFLKKVVLQEKNKKRKAKLRKIFQEVNFLFGQRKIWWVPPQKITERHFKKYFKIVQIKKASDYLTSERSPIFFLKKK
jgi:hypothetical protein